MSSELPTMSAQQQQAPLRLQHRPAAASPVGKKVLPLALADLSEFWHKQGASPHPHALRHQRRQESVVCAVVLCGLGAARHPAACQPTEPSTACAASTQTTARHRNHTMPHHPSRTSVTASARQGGSCGKSEMPTLSGYSASRGCTGAGARVGRFFCEGQAVCGERRAARLGWARPQPTGTRAGTAWPPPCCPDPAPQRSRAAAHLHGKAARGQSGGVGLEPAQHSVLAGCGRQTGGRGSGVGARAA